MKGPKVGRLFPLHVSPSTFIPSFPLLSFACNVVGSGNKMWHRRLGHTNFDVLCTLFNSGLLGSKACSSIDHSFDCTSCKLGKSKVLPFPHHASRASQCFELIHSNVWGIAPVVSHAHYKYFVTFIDDFSRFTWVHFLRAKGEVFSVFQRFLALFETQFSASIKVLRYDSGGEYMCNEFQVFLQSKEIISQRSCPSTPQQNGVIERKNRHLLDVVRTLLFESSVPPRFLCEALSTAIHLINRLPSPTTNHVSPFSKLFDHSPLYSDLRTFSCVNFVHLPPHERHKLTTQSVKCVFVGYAIPHKGYVCYDPHASRIRVSRNVIFFENQYLFPSHVQLSSASVSLLPIFSESLTIVEWFKPRFVYERRSRHESGSTSFVPPSNLDLAPDPAPTSTTLRQSTHPSRPLNWYGFFSHVSLVATLSTISIPSCYKHANEHECWQIAMQAELQALGENHT